MHPRRIRIAVRQFLRARLGRFLPRVRTLRSLPARRRAARQAARFQIPREIAVCYLTGAFPERPASRLEYAHGGAVKMTYLAERFPHQFPAASILYAVSSVDHPAKIEIVRTARARGVRVVLNQNGVAYPAWHGAGWEAQNRLQRQVCDQADFIVYQSEFCRQSAEKFLGTPSADSMVLFNPVDLDHFRPAPRRTRRDMVLLLGGNQYEQYRFEQAVLVFQAVRRTLPGSRLLVTGNLWGEDPMLSMAAARDFLRRTNLEGQVDFTGRYSQQEAPKIFEKADILIHTKYNDPSPTLIGEALASGLPVVYSASGGTPELVGPRAGIGIPVESGWHKISLPDPQAMAAAVLRVWEDHEAYGNSARARAVELFSLDGFADQHRGIFERLIQ